MDDAASGMGAITPASGAEAATDDKVRALARVRASSLCAFAKDLQKGPPTGAQPIEATMLFLNPAGALPA